MYLDKRIHYTDMTYKTRQSLWTLDWNEHVDRPFTSCCSSITVAHEHQNLGGKKCQKQYNFVEDIWNLWTAVCQV